MKDLKRTHSFADPLAPLEDEANLLLILQCAAYVYPHIGYCQGMNYIAHTIQSTCEPDDVEQANLLMLALMRHLRLAGMYADSVPEYHIQSFVLEQLLDQELPNVCKHIRKL